MSSDSYPVTKSDAEWKAELSPEQYRVLRQHGTERPGASPLNAEKRNGAFFCAACEQALFRERHEIRERLRLAEFLRPAGGRGRHDGRSYARHAARGSALRTLRRPSGPRVPGRTEADRSPLLHERRLAHLQAGRMMDDLLAELRSLLAGETDPIANAANTASLLFARISGLNWAGFYFLHGETLVVGPFQGLPACTRIPLGRGGLRQPPPRAARPSWCRMCTPSKATSPCDSASLSEIVVPFGIGGGLSGVLDIDSPLPDRFSESDRVFFEAVAQAYVEACTQP